MNNDDTIYHKKKRTPGGGRKKIQDDTKIIKKILLLPTWLWKWLDENNKNRSQFIKKCILEQTGITWIKAKKTIPTKEHKTD